MALLFESCFKKVLNLVDQSGVRLFLEVSDYFRWEVQGNNSGRYSSVRAFDRLQLSICLKKGCGVLFCADGFKAYTRLDWS